MKVYCITGEDVSEDGEGNYLPTKAAAIKECNGIAGAAEVSEIELAKGLGARELACLLLNRRGFAASQKVIHRNKAMREWRESNEGAAFLGQFNEAKE